MRISEQMNLLYITIGVASGDYFDNLKNVDLSKLEANLALNNDVRDFVNSASFFYEMQALLNKIDSRINAEILRRKQETQETYSRPKEYHDDCR